MNSRPQTLLWSILTDRAMGLRSEGFDIWERLFAPSDSIGVEFNKHILSHTKDSVSHSLSTVTDIPQKRKLVLYFFLNASLMQLSHIWGFGHEDTTNTDGLFQPDVVRCDKIPTANHSHGLSWWNWYPEWHPCYLLHQGNVIKHRSVSSWRSVLAGNMWKWASRWPGGLQGMLRRHCRPQLTHVHTYFHIHTSSSVHAFLGPGRWCWNNGRKRKWELCEDLTRIRWLSLTLQQTPALYFHLISLTRLSLKWHLCISYLHPSLHFYIKLSLFYSSRFLCFLWIEEAEECCAGSTLIILRHCFLFPHQFPSLLGNFLSLG